MLRVIIDTRETSLLPFVQELLQDVEGVDVSSEMLEIGDIKIGDSLLFERKTMSDLAASIKDGRYKEQKHRMLATMPAHRITYIIESASGSGGGFLPTSGEYGLSKDVLMGMYMNTMYRDGIHVVHVKNTRETAQWISVIAKKIAAKPEVFDADAGGAANYALSCKAKTRKMENIDANSCYRMQLAQIPTVSHKLAQNIAEVYPTMMQLLRTLDACDTREACVALFAKIPLIGKKKAITLIDYLKPSHP